MLVLIYGAFSAQVVACQPQEKPQPKKVENENPFDRQPQPKAKDPDSPLRNPQFEAPRAREGKQIPEAEIEAALAEAAEAMAVNNTTLASIALERCANKLPADTRCDGEMGLALIGSKKRRAAALYYLQEAAAVDDPKADAGFYLRLGDALSSHGEYEPAVGAMEKAVARDASAENLFALGRALSLRPDRVREAAGHIAEARAKDDRVDWLYEEAVLRGQLRIREEALAAAALLKTYSERSAELGENSRKIDAKDIETRVAELEALAPTYPTTVEWEAQQAKKDQAPGEQGADAQKADAPVSPPQ